MSPHNKCRAIKQVSVRCAMDATAAGQVTLEQSIHSSTDHQPREV